VSTFVACLDICYCQASFRSDIERTMKRHQYLIYGGLVRFIWRQTANQRFFHKYKTQKHTNVSEDACLYSCYEKNEINKTRNLITKTNWQFRCSSENMNNYEFNILLLIITKNIVNCAY